MQQQPYRGLHSSLDDQQNTKKDGPKPEDPAKALEKKRMEVAKKHSPPPVQPRPQQARAPGAGGREGMKPVQPPPGKDMAGDLEKSIEWAADKFKWDPRTSDAVSEAASSLANEMAGINVDKLKLLKTTKGHREGVPDRIYFKDEDGHEWEVVREEDGWDWHPVKDS